MGRLGGAGRLPSFKGQRDLTLGGSGRPAAVALTASSSTGEKKKFVPNLNVQRRKEEIKKEVEDGPPIIPLRGRPKNAHHHGGKHGDGAQGGGGFKARAKPELIQTMGSVFGEGISAEGIRRKTGGGGGGGGGREGGSDSLQRPTMSRESAVKVNKEEEERRLKALLKDDFISDLSCEGLFVPVQLPMVDTGKLFKAEEEEDEDKIMSKKKPRANRILDSDDEDEPPAKSGGILSKEKAVTARADDAELTFPDLVRSQKGDLIFIQLPDHLPGVVTQVKKEDGVAATEEVETKCLLTDLPEGYLGKIQVRRSGKTQLKIGEALLDIDLGTQVGFLQDLVSIRMTADVQEVGEMTVMGRVRHRMVVTPDWDNLFKPGGGPQGDNSSGEEEDS
jgi:DNA-directed RNA polymerase III subunit RPC4